MIYDKSVFNNCKFWRGLHADYIPERCRLGRQQVVNLEKKLNKY